MTPRTLKGERLERRDLLTSRLIIDFGRGVGFDEAGEQNALQTTTGELRNVAGQGMNGRGTGPSISDAENSPTGSIDLRPVSYDWNNDNLQTEDDIVGLRDEVLALVRRAVEPFDIEVLEGQSQVLSDVEAVLASNDSNPSAGFDAYVFVVDAVSEFYSGTSVGQGDGLFGRAALDDLLAYDGNQQDEAAIVFADVERAAISGDPTTPEYRNVFAARLAHSALHEAFHTFGYDHTLFPGPEDDPLISEGDVIQVSSGNLVRAEPVTVTRFPILRAVDSVIIDHFLFAANDDPTRIDDSNIGVRDTNGNGVADIGYITGTGANDLITIAVDPTNSNVVQVSIVPYNDEIRSDQAFFLTLNEPAEYHYSIHLDGSGLNPWDNTDGVILIDASHGSDRVEIEAAIAADFRIRTLSGNDEVVIKGSPTPRIRSFLFEGEGGDDQLTFDFTTGDPMPRAGFDFAFDGGAGFDTVEVVRLENNQPVTRPAFFVDAPILVDYGAGDVPAISIGPVAADSASPEADRHTLRSAIASANALGEAAYVFLPSAPIDLTLQGANDSTANDLDVTGDITVIGAGAGASVVNGFGSSYSGPADAKQTFHVSGAGASLDLSRVTLRGTDTSPSSAAIGGGAILAENSATLRVAESAIVAAADATGTRGVGIASISSNTVIERSVFVPTDGQTGSMVYAAGPIGSAGSLTIEDSLFAGNGSGGSTPYVVVSGGTVQLATNGANLHDNASGGFFDTVPGASQPLASPTQVVTSTADTWTATPDSEVLSLRDAIFSANSDPAGLDEIWLPAWNFTLTRRLDDADLYDTTYNDLDVLGGLVVRGVHGKTSIGWIPTVVDEVFQKIGDFEPDGDVDISDFGLFSDAFGSVLGDANYDARADYDSDNDVDISDFGIFSDAFDTVFLLVNVAVV